jgi:hypothetical protein
MWAVPARCQDDSYDEDFSPEQLDNLLAPIALYPDPLLAQVLVAATFPDQIDEAARFVRGSSDPDAIDDQPWDVSVKAVAHYPTVLDMMADKLDWTTALGQAYVNQATDVMTSVQRLREQARSAGNLVTTPQQEVVESDGYIEIWPAEPQYIYVPVYDPAVVYFRRGGFFTSALISFGRGFRIGVWLNNDCDWREHRVYYHGWEHGGGWMGRSRPYVRVTNVYVNANYRNVVVNRNVVRRNINYGALDRYQGVHRGVKYDNLHGRGAGGNQWRQIGNSRPAAETRRPAVENKVIQRNFNTNDPRIDAFRGRQPSQQVSRPEASRPEVNRPEVNRPEVNRPQVNRPQVNQPQVNQPQVNQPQMNRPETNRPQVVNRPQVNRPANEAQTRQRERADDSAFGGNRGGFDARAASQRGQASRAQAARPEPARAPSRPAREQKQPESRSRRSDK